MITWLRFDTAEDRWRPAAAAPGAPLVADSWLVCGARVRGLELHWERFAGAASELIPGWADRSGPLREAVERALPPSGRWFPRLELRSGGEVALGLRPAPAREPEVVAWIADEPDPRRHPRRKGPDLDRLGALRARGAQHGAGEALIAAPDGRVLEGAYSSILWWEGDVLWTVPDDAPILPGVTRRLLLDLAAADGTPVAARRPAPDELHGREVWLTSALHGIRAVTGWANPDLRAGPAERAAPWQQWLEALAVVPGARDGSARRLEHRRL